jgi:hypothetical protein
VEAVVAVKLLEFAAEAVSRGAWDLGEKFIAAAWSMVGDSEFIDSEPGR